MITLATSGTLKGKAGTATAITYTISGDAVTTTDAFQILGQGQLAASTGDLLTTTPVPSSTSYLIKNIVFTNTTASPVTGIILYVNGSTSGNQIVQFSLVANGSAVYNNGGWQTYDSGGNLLFGSGFVVSVTATDGSITVGGTSSAPTISRAALTGDVTASAGSNATTLATVNTVTPGTFGSATATPVISVNGKGLTTASAQVTVTPAVGSVTGLGTGVATALGNNVGSAGAPVTFNGAGGTPSSITLTNGSGLPTTGLTGTLQAAQEPAHTGDATNTAGTLALTLKNTGPGATGPLGTGSTVPTVTIDAQGRVTGLTSTAIQSASTSQAGFESAAQFNTVQNLWFDVTNYGVSIGNSGAANTTAMNTLISTTAGAGATFFFPQTGANYPFNGAILVTKNDQKFRGQGQYSSVLFQNSTTDDLFRVSDGVQNVTFEDLGLWSAVTMSAGSAINTGTVSGTGVAQLYVRNVGFQGFGGTWFNCITLNGNTGGEVALVSYCQINSFTNYGIAQVGNTSTPSTVSSMVLENTTMNGQITSTTGAVAGVYVQQSGALNIDNSDVISCTNNVLFAPITSVSQIVASVYMINSFLDHSHGSCLKLGGTQPIVRIKLTASSFTVSNDAGGNYSAIEFSNTATNPPGDVDILSCNIQNTFNATTTTNGILITNASNVKIIGNNINGFTNNLQASAAAGGATKLNIVANSFGPGTVTAPTSTNDILLNAGTYGYIQITTNVFAPASPFQATSTNHINDSSTVANSALKRFGDNIGIANTGLQASIPTALQALTVSVDNLITGTSIPLPTNGLLVGQKFVGNFRIEKTTLAGTAAWNLKVKFGTANTAADAAIATFTSGTNTAIVDVAAITIFLEIVSLGAAATCKAYCIYSHSPGVAATGLGVIPMATASTATFTSTSANPFLHVDCTPGAAAVMTGAGSFYQIG